MIKIFKDLLRPLVHIFFEINKSLIKRSALRKAKTITSKVKGSKKGLFIDCGSNLGQGFSFFSKYFPLNKFDFILIEPNPYCENKLINKINERKSEGSIQLITKAASVKDGKRKFYGLERSNTAEGGSILKEHASAWYAHKEEEAINVDTFSFSELITHESQKYQTLVVKMDIEGGEYEVLEDLIKNNTHKKISLMFTEFHSQYMQKPDKKTFKRREKKIIKSFKQDRVPLKLWV